VEAEFFHTDGRADMKELIVVFRNFANSPKMSCTKFTTVKRNKMFNVNIINCSSFIADSLEILQSFKWLINSLKFMNTDGVLQFSEKPENSWFVFNETRV
jgi:hypothetical protein